MTEINEEVVAQAAPDASAEVKSDAEVKSEKVAKTEAPKEKATFGARVAAKTEAAQTAPSMAAKTGGGFNRNDRPFGDRKFGGDKKFGDKKFGDKKREPRREREREASEYDQKLVEVRRVAKVVAGGRTMRFSALVVVGNKKGLVGMGTGKAAEVPDAIEKAAAMAKKNLISVPMVGTTIPHDVVGKFSSSSVIMLPAKEGAGVIAGGSARAVLELAGVRDITAKAHGSTNKINCVRATIEGLKMLRTREQIAALRGKSAEEI